jgi:AcrR family transcriptional regulator
LDFDAFKDLVTVSKEDMYREFFRQNRARIKIKKERVAVRNLIKISEATLTLSNRKGFSAMSMRDLSAMSGLSMGALYSYFSSKDELLAMIQQESIRVATRVLDSRIEGIDDPRLKLKQAIFAHLYLSEVMHPWFYFSYMETKNLKKEARRKAIEIELFIEKIFADIIDDGQRTNVFRDVDRDLTAAMIKALLQDWYLKKWKYGQRNVQVAEYAGFLMEVVESYLLA